MTLVFEDVNSNLFSCPGQLNRWPCQSVTHWLTDWFFILAPSEYCRAVVDNWQIKMRAHNLNFYRAKGLARAPLSFDHILFCFVQNQFSFCRKWGWILLSSEYFFGIYGNFFVQKLPPPPVPISSRKLKLMDRWKVHKTKITDHTRQIQISLTSITEYLMDKWKGQQTKVTENTKFS